MLIVDNIGYEYNNHPILNGISFSLTPGQILCIIGPSGCGKTTLLQIIAQLRQPFKGTIDNKFACTAYVFQDPRLLPWQTTQDNLAFGLKARGIPKNKRHRIAKELAQQLGLAGALYQYPSQLSGGMQQRVALGRALAINPDLLLLDEPFKGLDVGRREQLQLMILRLLSDRHLATIIVTHDLPEAVRLGDEILVLSQSPAEIIYHWRSPRPP